MENNFKIFSIKTERLELVPQGIRFLESTHVYASDRFLTFPFGKKC